MVYYWEEIIKDVPSFFVSNKRIEHACYTEQYCAWTMTPLSVHSLIKGSWVINIRLHCLYFCLYALLWSWRGGRGYLNSDVAGRGAYICAHTRAPKVDPKCMFILVHHNDFRAFLYKCIYFKWVFSNYDDKLPHPKHFFFHWRKWFNENITLFIQKHTVPVSWFVLLNWQL